MVGFTNAELTSVTAPDKEDIVCSVAREADYSSLSPRDGALIIARVLLYPARQGTHAKIMFPNKTGTENDFL